MAEDKVKEQTPTEEVKEEAQVEVKEEVVEETTEEKKVEEENTEKPTEEVKEDIEEVKKETEEVKEESVEETPVEEVKKEAEDLKEEVEKSKEQLMVIKEVKAELASLYAQNKKLEQTVEQLSAEKIESEKTVEQLSKELDVYKQAELEIAIKKRQEFVEQLAKKYSELGQEKSVEQLSKLSDDVLKEFNEIAGLAIEQLGKTRKSESETVPSQGKTCESLSKDEKKVEVAKEVIKPKTMEQLSSKEFATMLIGKLASLESQTAKEVTHM
jgi:chromosome segregation ATPase